MKNANERINEIYNEIIGNFNKNFVMNDVILAAKVEAIIKYLEEMEEKNNEI
jgi:hypothetical protein